MVYMAFFHNIPNHEGCVLISNTWLILLNIVEIVINEVLPSFKILGQVVPEKSLTKISIFINNTGVRDRKSEK